MNYFHNILKMLFKSQFAGEYSKMKLRNVNESQNIWSSYAHRRNQRQRRLLARRTGR